MYDILLVEDDDSILFIVEKYKLWNRGDFVIKGKARDGKEALELLKHEKYDLIITDIRMPVIDGIELCREVRETNNDIGIILASTYSDFSYAREGIRLGALDYIEKPFTEEKLEEALKRVKDDKIKVKAEKLEKKRAIKEEVEKVYKNMKLGEERHFCYKLWKELEKKTDGMELLENLWMIITKEFSWLNEIRSLLYIKQEEKKTEKGFFLIQQVVEQFSLGKQDATTNKICKWSVEHILDENLIEQMEEEVALSRDYMAKLLRSRLGCTVSELVSMIKMEKGKELLLETNMKIYQIANALGYMTVDYFSKLFKNYTGMTPVQYRKENFMDFFGFS